MTFLTLSYALIMSLFECSLNDKKFKKLDF